jgi:hypothetical protein
LLQFVEGVSLAVAGHVEGGHMQQVGIVAEQTQPLVAPLAQQPADLSGLVVVIEVLRPRFSADGAPVVLRHAESC